MKKLYIVLILCTLIANSATSAINIRDVFSQCDSLLTSANNEAQTGNYDEAIAKAQNCIIILKKNLVGNHEFHALALNKLGRFYALKNDWSNAYKNAMSGNKMLYEIYDDNNINFALTLSDAAYYNARLNNLSFAKKDAEKSLSITQRPQNIDSELIYEILINQAYIYVITEEFKQAHDIILKAIDALEKLNKQKTIDYAKALSLLAIATSKTSLTQSEAITHANTALDLQQQLLPFNNHERAATLSRLSQIHLRNSDINNTLKYGLEALSMWDSLNIVSIEYEDCAWQLALLFNSNNQFNESLKLCDRLIQNIERKTISNPLTYSNLLSLRASSLHGLNQHNDAITAQQKSISVIEQEKSREHSSLISAYSNLAIYYIDIEDFKQALKSQTKSVKLSEKLYKNKRQHADALSRLADIHAMTGDYTSAINSQIKCNKILSDINPTDNALIYGLNDLAAYQFRSSMFENAFNTELEVIKLYEEKNQLNQNFATSLINAAVYAQNGGKTTQAKDLQRRGLDILRKFIPQTSKKYIDALTAYIKYCLECTDYNAALSAQKEKLQIAAMLHTSNSNEYAYDLDMYASILALDKKYDEAAKSEEEAINILKQNQESSIDDLMKRLAKYYSAAGKHEEAEKITDLTIKNTPQDTPSIEYAMELAQSANHKHLAGNNADALRLSVLSLETLEQTEAKGTAEHARALSSVAGYYALVHNNKEAARQGQRAVDIYSSLGDTANMATAINNLAIFYANLKEHSLADSLCNKALELQSAFSGDNSVEYARILSNVISTTFNTNNIDKAIESGYKVIKIFDDNNMSNTLEYANALNNQSVYLLNADRDDDAVKLLGQSLDIRKQVLGTNHPTYLHALVNLCKTLSSKGDDQNLINRATECTSSLTNMLRRQFLSLPANERSYYWNAWNKWFQKEMLQYTCKNPNPQMIESAFEGTIFAKGLMLNSECNLKDLIAESGSEDIDNLYSDLRDTRSKLNQLYTQLSASDSEKLSLSIDSLEHHAAKLERNLVNASKEYGDYTANLSVPISDIKAKLTDTDAAVEFVSFECDYSNDYYAFILTANDSVPQFIKIAAENDIISAKNDRVKLSQILWNPIAKKLDSNIKKIYFAPAGELYSLPIEYLPDFADSNEPIDKKWELYRLSSTRQLARLQRSDELTKATIIGGITYNNDGTPSPYDLPQTKIEAENIYKIIKPSIADILLLTTAQGSEQSIRNLSGKGYALLHIATHGFCISEEDADYQACEIFHNNAQHERGEDDMLKRSGLMLHGAVPTLMGHKHENHSQDGILTAMEIAELDFRGLDLAVLSACQTALGDVTGEGVFGLQRGFKKAGAKSLLMSLWKVDDTATQILMSRFYENISSGMNKKSALTDAQQFLANYTTAPQQFDDDFEFDGLENDFTNTYPYSAPEFWSAFILLDAIY